MKKILIILLIIPVALITYISCDNNFLDRTPLNEASDITFYQTESDAIAATNSIYDVMQYGRMWKFEISVIGNRYNSDLGIIPRPTQFPSDFQATNGRRLSMWENLYIGINRANIALERIPPIEMDEDLKARLLGEAKFLRGFYYFTLGTFFEDVPIRLEPTTLENLEKAKSPKADVIGQARQDLQEASQVLPERSVQDPADLGRATKGAAIAMLGKLELYQQNYNESAQHFASVISSNEYMLDAEYAPQFLAGGDNTPESVFEVQHAVGGGGWNDSNEGSWMSGWNSSTQPDAVNFGFGGGFQPNEEFVNAFEEGDLRGEFIIVEEGEDFFGAPYDASRGDTPFGLRKYVFPKQLEQQAADSEINFHIIRYADVLLMYAEALNEVNGGPTEEAYQAINAVRTRAGLADLVGLSQQAFFDAIVQERRIELFLEAHRTWDLIRWGIAPDVLGATNGFVANRHERLPVPQTELDTNPLMEQHPAYQ
ncbi:MAG: RagB/SusD family nutrient uptake outer membrane protein [Bacteroidota bacterium]